ncbi:Nuclear factor of activated T-cells, cytoplasmic 1 [Liparis tanakae]|uniref:Nuclear factor of activated T-cells, cytoplasmic 1 n=1 Tax=Liparis tanakae TaxID=230148 RepID=A0A4Z2F8H6_9TELE|nr:Nuclear factor of activated T-cells, cytoplasmic 1 [Liparis tanakae]
MEMENGHHLWETEAKVDKDSVKNVNDSCCVRRSTVVVEIPPYRNQRISSPVQVNFYVCNGKRKRSQYQRFTYLPPNGNHHRHSFHYLFFSFFDKNVFSFYLNHVLVILATSRKDGRHPLLNTSCDFTPYL